MGLVGTDLGGAPPTGVAHIAACLSQRESRGCGTASRRALRGAVHRGTPSRRALWGCADKRAQNERKNNTGAVVESRRSDNAHKFHYHNYITKSDESIHFFE